MVRTATIALAALAALAPFARLAQDAPAAPEEPAPARGAARDGVSNIVIVTIDTVRADRLGCYGYFRDTSPRLDAFAATALRFTRCLTPIAQTTPSHWTIFSGVPPHEHGVVNNFSGGRGGIGGRASTATLRTVAERLAEAGVRTGGFAASTPCKRVTGLAAGFQTWSEPEDDYRRLGSEVVADALAFLAADDGRPFFAWVHLYDAHEPLRPPHVPDSYLSFFPEDERLATWIAERHFARSFPELDKRGLDVAASNQHYDGALRFLDDQLAPLLDRLDAPDLRETTAVVVVADHGTALGQHDHYGHGVVWDEQLRVPLLLRVPGVAPAVVDEPCSTLDLWPTLFGLAPALAHPGIAAQCRGRDALAEEGGARPLVAIAAKSNGDGITAGRYKLVRMPPLAPRLYDLAEDPHELHDLAAAKPEVVARLTELIRDEIARQKPTAPHVPPTTTAITAAARPIERLMSNAGITR